jgi:hypothetical protein
MESMFGEEDLPVMAMYRFLQEETKKKVYDAIDYTVLSVAVATLGLILVVEILRHKIDHMAQGRPFFLTVLHSVNSECTSVLLFRFQRARSKIRNSRFFFFFIYSGYTWYCRVCCILDSEVLCWFG